MSDHFDTPEGKLSFSGYSWKTNQVGLAIDTIVAYELVKPSGEVVKVTEKSDSELFFGLKVCPVYSNCELLTLKRNKGGLNNFVRICLLEIRIVEEIASHRVS